MAGVSTITEQRKNWDINDLYDANEALDIQDEFEEHFRKENERKNK